MLTSIFSQAYEGVKSVTRVAFTRVVRLASPAPKNEGSRRTECMLNAILVISICFLSVLELTTLHDHIIFDAGIYAGIDPLKFGGLIFLFMSLIAWLSNKEINKSLERARSSERLLEIERNSLEQKIAERTKELVATQDEHIENLQNAAQFGKLSQGLFHDLISPLSSISIYTEQLISSRDKSAEYLKTVQKMIDVSKRMNSFMENLKHYTGREHSLRKNETSDIVKEIEIARDILSYKARMAKVAIYLDLPKSLFINLNQHRTHQLILNLLSNAIEACETAEKTNLDFRINIRLKTDADHIILSITDNGIGIPDENMNLIFIKPFTTKEIGTGRGLMTIKSIVEKELHGNISIHSKKYWGTSVTIKIPLSKAISPSPPSQTYTPHPGSSSSKPDTAGLP